jgi:hypothetical protein
VVRRRQFQSPPKRRSQREKPAPISVLRKGESEVTWSLTNPPTRNFPSGLSLDKGFRSLFAPPPFPTTLQIAESRRIAHPRTKYFPGAGATRDLSRSWEGEKNQPAAGRSCTPCMTSSRRTPTPRDCQAEAHAIRQRLGIVRRKPDLRPEPQLSKKSVALRKRFPPRSLTCTGGTPKWRGWPSGRTSSPAC